VDIADREAPPLEEGGDAERDGVGQAELGGQCLDLDPEVPAQGRVAAADDQEAPVRGGPRNVAGNLAGTLPGLARGKAPGVGEDEETGAAPELLAQRLDGPGRQDWDAVDGLAARRVVVDHDERHAGPGEGLSDGGHEIPAPGGRKTRIASL
jgi:hypothetical protein